MSERYHYAAETGEQPVHAGRELLQSLTFADLRSLRTRSTNLQQLERIDAAIVIGSSGTGKTTLEHLVREASVKDPLLQGRISVPKKVITRELRPGETDVVYTVPEAFPDLITSKSLGLYGTKLMEGGREERYGFLSADPATLPVFFANNGIVKNPELVQPEGLLQHALLIAIYAPEEIREARLRHRSPEYFTTKAHEGAFRLSEEERAANFIRQAHIVVKNFGRYEPRVGADLVTLLRIAADHYLQ